jgi:dCMP deaminase
MHRIEWDDLYIRLAYLIAQRSPDLSTQLGAVIVAPDQTIRSTGYNGWPRGIAEFEDDDPRWNRPNKYHWMAHAERNAIDNAIRNGVAVDGCTLYTILMPCADCARGIVQTGIKRVVFDENAMREFTKHMLNSQTWVEGLEATRQMFKETNIELQARPWKETPDTIRIAGTIFNPNQDLDLSNRPILRPLGNVQAEKI